MKNKRILFGGIVAAGLLTLAGSAFTASNSMPAGIVRGYGEQVVTGVVAESITYGLNATKDNVDTVELVLTGDTTALAIEIAFNDDVPAVCSDAGAYDGDEDASTYLCAVDQATADIDRFVLVASS